MKFLSTWLRNQTASGRKAFGSAYLNEVPEHMAQECVGNRGGFGERENLNEVPEHMAQESNVAVVVGKVVSPQ